MVEDVVVSYLFRENPIRNRPFQVLHPILNTVKMNTTSKCEISIDFQWLFSRLIDFPIPVVN